MVANSSAIRAMFEEGNRLAKIYGAENVFDFSLGNPNVPAPEAVKKAMIEDISLALAKEINEQFALGINDGYLEPFAFALQKRIKNAEIRNLHVVI